MPRKLPWQRKTVKEEEQEETFVKSAVKHELKPERELKGRNTSARKQFVKVEEVHEEEESDSDASMKSGLDADDQWKMVEDELLAIAHDHTKSMHKKEYEERMAAAKMTAENRPASKPSELYEWKALLPRPPHKKKTRIADESDDEVLDEEGRNVLAGTTVGALLTAPKRTEAKLRREGTARRANTRAAAGLKPYESFVARDSQSQASQQTPGSSFVQSFLIKNQPRQSHPLQRSSPPPQPTQPAEDSEDDDLDAYCVKKPKTKPAPAPKSSPSKVRLSTTRPATPPRRAPPVTEKTAAKGILKTSPPMPAPATAEEDEDLFIDPAEEFLMELQRKKAKKAKLSR